jgi:phosphoribosyl 1,2-cyclic phosphodiesterase
VKFSSEIRVHSLASGSSGNAMLVQSGETNLLIDAGLSLRALGQHLTKRGVVVGNLSGVLLTHEHHDHGLSANAVARRYNAPLIANSATLHALHERTGVDCSVHTLPTGHEWHIGGVCVRSFSVSHDAAEPVGYTLQTSASKIVYCTDNGCRTPHLTEALHGAALAIIEANYETDWLWRGTYTPEMKARVASDTGHLSNQDCAKLLAERLDNGSPLCVWLAHLSRNNNSPNLAKRMVSNFIKNAVSTPFTLEIALRDHPSLTWRSGQFASQMCLL